MTNDQAELLRQADLHEKLAHHKREMARLVSELDASLPQPAPPSEPARRPRRMMGNKKYKFKPGHSNHSVEHYEVHGHCADNACQPVPEAPTAAEPLESLIERARNYVMTPEEEAAQVENFAQTNVALSRPEEPGVGRNVYIVEVVPRKDETHAYKKFSTGSLEIRCDGPLGNGPAMSVRELKPIDEVELARLIETYWHAYHSCVPGKTTGYRLGIIAVLRELGLPLAVTTAQEKHDA